MTLRVTGVLATILEKIFSDEILDRLGIFTWTPEDEKFLLNAEMEYYRLTGIKKARI